MADETTIIEVTPNDSWFELDIVQRFQCALKSGFMVDLNVKLQDGNVRCHSNFLGISSPKLAAMIQNDQHEIKLPGVKCNTFKTLLRIMYSEEADEIKNDVTKLQEIAKVAHELKIYTAVTYCMRLLRELLNTTNVCSILDLVILLNHPELKEACTKVIREQTEAVLKTDGFLKCDVATLEHILKQETIHNVTELGLFQSAVRWAKRHDNPRETLGSSLSLIRFRTFTTEDIAAYVKPAKLLSDKEEQELLWYLLSKGKGEMPAGFNNERGKRHTTWSAEHVRASTEEISLGWSDGKFVTKQEILATPPLRISLNEDAFLIGVKPWSTREDKTYGDKYMEDVEVTLKDDKGTLFATATFRGEVERGSCYDVKFPHAVELYADVKYELHFSHKMSGVRHRTCKHSKQGYNSTTSLKISLLETEYSPIWKLIIAPKCI